VTEARPLLEGETQNHFICAHCKKEFGKAIESEVAWKETEEMFPDEVDDDEPMEIVCDDCWKKMEKHFGWDQA